jgi:hypothetical protein
MSNQQEEVPGWLGLLILLGLIALVVLFAISAKAQDAIIGAPGSCIGQHCLGQTIQQSGTPRIEAPIIGNDGGIQVCAIIQQDGCLTITIPTEWVRGHLPEIAAKFSTGIIIGGHHDDQGGTVTASSDLDRAYALCEKHHDQRAWTIVYPEGGGPSLPYAQPWTEACNTVRAKWQDGETAKAQRAAAAQEAADLEFVKKVAGE